MSWIFFGLSKEPNLSITPLVKEEELSYFVNRERELTLLRSYFDSDYPQHILISGRAGTGKTSLVCHEGIGKQGKYFMRIDLSRFHQQGDILDVITLDLIDYACRLKIKEAQSIREDFIYQIRELKEEIISAEGGVILAKGKMSSKRAREKVKRYLSMETEQVVEKILLALEKNLKTPPVIFLDESDHLPDPVQETILSRIETFLISRRCKVIFSTRKEIEKVFLGDVNSKYRARFADIIPMQPISSSTGNITKIILQKRFEPLAGKDYNYPFMQQTDTFLQDICEGNIRELLRYASYILNEAIKIQPPKPIKIDFAIKTLGQKGILVSEIESREYQILKILASRSLSPSDKMLQQKTHLKRSTLNIILRNLDEKGTVQGINQGKKVLYALTPKGKWIVEAYETTRL